jgi:hypothetical protein
MLFAVWAIAGSLFAGYYWVKYNDVQTRIANVMIYVNIGVDYHNGSRVWYNDTKALTGQTLFDVTKHVVDVDYEVDVALGLEVTSIGGAEKQGGFGWTYWIWNSTERLWSILWDNADSYQVTNAETFMWYYQDASFAPPP